MSLDLDFVPADRSVPSVALLWSLIGALPDEAVRWVPAPQSHSIGAVLLHVADSDQYRQFPNDGGIGRSGELHFLEAALRRLTGQ